MTLSSTPDVPLFPTRHRRRPLWRLALIVVAYLLAFLGLDLVSRTYEELRGVVAWYPPAGLSFALLLVFGARFAPAVTIASLASSLLIYRMPQPVYALFLWALVVSSIYGATAAFLRHRTRFDWRLHRLQDVTTLILTAVPVSALLAVLSVSSSALSSDMPHSEVPRAIFDWWIGESVGVLTITPFLLVYVMPWLKRFAEGPRTMSRARRSLPRPTLTFVGQAASLALALYWVFGARVPDTYRPLYLVALPLIWIALDRGFTGVTVGIVASSSGVILATWLFGLDVALLGGLELLMIVMCVIGLTMGAVVTARRRAEEALRLRSQIAEIFLACPDEEMYGQVLQVILEMMQSRFGAFGYLDAAGAWVVPSMTRDIWDQCRIPDKSIVSPRDTWGDSSRSRAIREKRLICSNEPSVDVPTGQIAIRRHISMPIMFDDEVIGLIQVANKDVDYTEADIETLESVAGQVAPILNARLKRRQDEEEIRHLNADLERRVAIRTTELELVNRELETFSYSVSHDLRAPLRALDGFSHILARDYGKKLDAEGRGYLERIGKAAQKMGMLIDGLLELSRLNRGEMHLGAIDLGALAREIVTELSEAEPQRRVVVEIEDGLHASADRDLVRALLTNLVGNAWKFTSTDESARIEIGAADDDRAIGGQSATEGEVVFFVRDDGVGFDMAYADKLFAPFQRLHDPAQFEGTGIGLATVQRIVQRHGGRVWAESEVGKGATFFFTLAKPGGHGDSAIGVQL